MDHFPNLRVISNFGVGVDHINLNDAKQVIIIIYFHLLVYRPINAIDFVNFPWLEETSCRKYSRLFERYSRRYDIMI